MNELNNIKFGYGYIYLTNDINELIDSISYGIIFYYQKNKDLKKSKELSLINYYSRLGCKYW